MTEIRISPLPMTGDNTLYQISWNNVPSSLVHRKVVSIGPAIPRWQVAHVLAKELLELSKRWETDHEES